MEKPIIYWIRRDFRIDNNPALKFAIESEQPIIPVFIKDEFVDSLGSAPKWRLELGLEYLAQQYKTYGLDIIFKTGSADKVLTELINETNADKVVWGRTYLPPLNDRDAKIKSLLKQKGVWQKVFQDTYYLSRGAFHRNLVTFLKFTLRFGKQQGRKIH